MLRGISNGADASPQPKQTNKVPELQYLELPRLAGMVFVPLVVVTIGGWEEQGEKQIRRMGAALVRQTGQDEAVKTRHLFQRLSILLTKGNAALFLNRLPSHPGPTIDGEQ